MDRDKVINGLEELRGHLFHEYQICYHGDKEDVCRQFLVVDDAIALLKEIKPIKKDDMYFCGWCKNALAKTWRFCPKCGTAVKWDV